MRAHKIVRAHISRSPQASLGMAGTVPWTRVSAREPQELREEELREALGTMTGQENERGEVFDELRDRRVEKCYTVICWKPKKSEKYSPPPKKNN